MDGSYIGRDFLIYYNNDEHIHVIPKQSVAFLHPVSLCSSGPTPRKELLAFVVQDADSALHRYLLGAATPRRAEFEAILKEWGVPFREEERDVIIDHSDDYY